MLAKALSKTFAWYEADKCIQWKFTKPDGP